MPPEEQQTSPTDAGGDDTNTEELFAEPSGSSTETPDTPPDQPDEPDGAATP